MYLRVLKGIAIDSKQMDGAIFWIAIFTLKDVLEKSVALFIFP